MRGDIVLECIIIDIFMLYFQKYLHSFIESAVFTGRVARQTNRLYVLRMTVKLAYTNRTALSSACMQIC